MQRFLETHPWITFKATDINDLSPRLWMLLGEARSKSSHLAGTPLRPDVARELYEVTIIKGALGTTAIEGNTLTEDQVAGILRGTFQAPPSRAYQEREVRNVLDVLNEIDEQILRRQHSKITKDLICEYNARILEGTEYEADVVPGQIRTHEVNVNRYRGAPAQDCEYLLDELADWLESDTFRSDDPEINFALTIASAIYAHLYIAWIHPFGDGNGRTARLLEFLILARGGEVPLPAAHLLSNHYNLTRDQYYRELAAASRALSTTGFFNYAVQGLVDGIRDQIDLVRDQQVRVTWINYVHETMNEFPASQARDRRRSLVLAMPSTVEIARDDLPGLTPKLASLYARSGPRTLSRDLNELERIGLIHRTSHRGNTYVARDNIIRAFMPPIAEGVPHP